MTDLQAAIGIAQMKKINENLMARKKIAALYENEFQKYGIDITRKNEYAEPVYWVYPILFKSRKIRLQVGRGLKKEGIPFLSFFWPCHKQPFYNYKETLPVTETVSERGLTIPCNSLVTEQEAINLTKIIGHIVKNA